MPISQQQLSSLNKFIGYGSENPDFVCIGIEEYAQKSTLTKNWDTRISHYKTPLDDLYITHQKLEQNQVIAANPLDSEPCPVIQWMECARIICALQKNSLDVSDEDVSHFIKTKLGRSDSNNLLAEFHSVPQPYKKYEVDGYKKGENWENERRALLKNFFKTINPATFLIYGDAYGNLVNDIFDFADGMKPNFINKTTRVKSGLTKNNSIIITFPFIKKIKQENQKKYLYSQNIDLPAIKKSYEEMKSTIEKRKI